MLLTVPLEPVPAARPRVSRWGTYYPAKYKNFKTALGAWFRKNYTGGRLTSAFILSLRIVCTRPKTTKLAFPRPDVDNYAKGVMDAGNEVLWEDDQLCTQLKVSKEWAAPGEPGRIELEIR